MKITRRTFLQIAAVAGAGAAATPAEGVVRKLIPWISPPENIKPGVWTLYATTCRECPAGCGMHVRVVDGRPINVQGNPSHPVNHGGLCARGQSCVQGLYDPDRLQVPASNLKLAGSRPTWSGAIADIGERIRKTKGRVVVLSGLETGTLADVMQKFAAGFGSTPVIYHEPFDHEALRMGHEEAFGNAGIPEYNLQNCELIVSFAADFLETWLSPVQFAEQFAAARALDRAKPARFVYVGPRLSMTAANADEFIRVPPGGVMHVAQAMLAVMQGAGVKAQLPDGVSEQTVRRIAKMFLEAPSSVALAGPAWGASVIAKETARTAALMNHAAGRVGTTVDFSRTHALGSSATTEETRRLLDSITPDDVIIVHNTNPAFTLPGAETALKRAGTVVYLGTMPDETAAIASYVLPIDSPLESWGDNEPWTGYHSLMQPMIRRLYDTRNAGDILIELAKAAGHSLSPATFEECLARRWDALRQRVSPQTGMDEFWRTCLRNGGVWETPAKADVKLNPMAAAHSVAAETPAAKADELALWAWPSVMLYDGRTANRGWLQEAPDPTSTIVWGSWVDIHPKTAASLGVTEEDVVELKGKAGAIEVPVRVTEDVAEGTAAIAFGQGHTAMGRNAKDRGANAFRLLDAGAALAVVAVRRTSARRTPTRTCATQEQHGREIVLWASLADVAGGRIKPPEGFALPVKEGYDPKVDVYPGHDYAQHRWVMTVDLDKCVGCGACAVACYAENNIAVVGEEMVGRSRLMAWLRIVPYRDPSDARRLGFLPIMCQQCDSAPCEPVCPVFASVHSDEGLNSQVYNRCIGTRYCSNNCPYKVRRFNWLNADWQKPASLQLNPDVTVRERGVMEKCTFCIQRIRQAEIAAKRENRAVRDGEIVPACAQSCPTKAIVFGDLLDKNSRVAALTRTDPRRYHVLEELRTRPGVTYLQRIRRGNET